MHEMEKQIAIYAAGFLIAGSLLGTSSKKPTMEKLANLDEVWAMCARKPLAGQIRILGRFYERSIFVGLEIYNRGFLGSRENYHKVAEKIPDRWVDVFGSKPAHTGETLSDYLSGVVRDVDEQI